MIRALIVDDEPPARDLLRSLLAREPAVEVVGEAAEGHEAVARIEELRPDVVFLDVQMPELDGFGVIEAVGPERMPLVVFVTAYDRYALKAFDVHALDYLLKPYDEERLASAVRHTADRLRDSGVGGTGAQLAALLDHLQRQQAGPACPARLPIRSDGRVRFVEVASIDWIEADDKVVRLHTGKDAHVMRSTLAAVARRLDPARFVRIHRSTIVNTARIREIQPWFHNDYMVILADGTELMTGRAYRAALKQLMGSESR